MTYFREWAASVHQNKNNFLRHVKEQHETQRFSCSHCNYQTNRTYQLSEHKKTHILKPLTPQVSKPSPQRKKSVKVQNSERRTISQPIQQDESLRQDEPVRSAFRGKIQ